ncbi:MAG: competence protein ComEA [Sulfuricurvum sp. PD_MW2]|jgi:competence protein ComEA|uniref:ComEA family DNA-binding protein n=1 Tax=Sulfuricurvum sp. PD_MW2 TaxID=2027917 RepID=UPI000C05D74A|nr:helix-hairpin-helix domain-containing protein [Sulfuricurvum sp. PD_MW2]PHM16726.1 MAG: competence protein ComEA [Sulfuricurvum sp. PD_MW2]
MVRIVFFLMTFFVFLFGSVNINAANSAQLQTLYGIGPAKAQEILRYRKMHGGFKSVDELVNVKGIGEKTMIKLRPQISVH